MAKPDWGWYTQKGTNLYAHIFDRDAHYVRMKGLHGKVKRVRRLSDDAKIIPARPVQAARNADDVIIRSDRSTFIDREFLPHGYPLDLLMSF